jgi:PKD repeat protein
MALRCVWASLLLISLGVMVLTVFQASAADQLEVFAGQDKLQRLGFDVVFNDVKLVRPDPPDPMMTYHFAWDFNASQDLNQDGIYDNDNESTTLLTQHGFTAPGQFTVTLTVTDSAGGMAKDTCKVTIIIDELPVAQIIGISPNPVIQGDDVVFSGSGTDSDGLVVGYEWAYDSHDSGHDGTFTSKGPTFNTSSLYFGNYTIRLRVHDDKGFWSEPVTAELEVKPNQQPTITVLTTKTRTDAGTIVDLVVRYTDSEDDVPISALLHLGKDNGNYHQEPLEQVDKTDSNCTDGKDYHYRARLNETGNYTYFFEFKNPVNGLRFSQYRRINVTEPKGSTPGLGSIAAVAAILLAVGTHAAIPAHRHPFRRDAL